VLQSIHSTELLYREVITLFELNRTINPQFMTRLCTHGFIKFAGIKGILTSFKILVSIVFKHSAAFCLSVWNTRQYFSCVDAVMIYIPILMCNTK